MRKSLKIDEIVKFVDAIKSTHIPVIAKPGKVSVHIATADLKGDYSIFPFIGQTSKSIFSKNGDKKAVRKSSAQLDPKEQGFNEIDPTVSHDVCAGFYDYNPFHFRCIQVKAACTAGLGYNILPLDSNMSNPELDPEYKKIDAFAKSCNDNEEPLCEVIKNWLIEKQIYGHGYLEVVSNKQGELAEVYNLRTYYTRILLDKDGTFKLKQNVGGKIAYFNFIRKDSKPDDSGHEVLAHRSFNLKTKYYGVPEWYSATMQLSLDRSIGEFHIKSFRNNLLFDLAIICEGGEIDSEGIKQVTAFLSSNYKGVENAGKAIYLNSERPDVKIHIEKVGREVRDMSFRSLYELSRDAIVTVHGIPGKVLGIATPGQLGGGEADVQFQIFNQTLIRPEREIIQAKINSLFQTRMGITKFRIEFKELDVENFFELAQSANLLVPTGILDADEARTDILGYAPRQEQPKTIEKEIESMKQSIRRIQKRLEKDE